MVNDIETNVLEQVQEPTVEPVQEQEAQVEQVQGEVYTGQSRVDANYNIISDEEKAYAEYQNWQKQQELFKPENRLKEKGDFVLRELERGIPLKQAMYEAGLGKENLAEPSALLDPVNLVVDIFTGGTLRGLKLAREGGEIGLRHALTSMSKASAVDAGYGLLASSGIDMMHEFTDNSLIQMVGGVTTPVVASTLVQGFRRTGIQGLKAIADNLRRNNPELAEQLAKQADNYAEANLAINTASRSEVINDGSITGVAQNINTASTDLAHAIDAPRVNVQTSQDLRQQSQEALSKAANAKTDEERSMHLAEAFNKAFVDAFRTPEQKKALEVVQDTISRSMQPENVAHNSPVSASGETLGMKGSADVQASTQGNSVGSLLEPTETAYHYSPHVFDEFDTARIGSGEGSQSYGWGLYFAENPKVANSYQQQLAPGAGNKAADTAARALEAADGDKTRAIQILEDRKQLKHVSEEGKAWFDEAIATLKDDTATGKTYAVKLPDKNLMLDLDKTLGEQSDSVVNALKSAGRLTEENASKTGKEFYQELTREFKSDKAASEYLDSLNVPGAKYLDQASRAEGSGTSNYVVFSKNNVHMLDESGNIKVKTNAQNSVEQHTSNVKAEDSNNNKNYVKPYTSEEIEGFKKAVLENDLAAPQNKVDYNYDKIADGRDLKELIAKSFESFDFSKVTEGTRTWNEAVSIAENHGLYDLVKTFRNTKNLDSQTFGALKTMHSLGDEVLRLSREATVAMTPESVVKAEHAIELFTDSLLMAKGIQTEIARGLGIMRKMRVGGEDIASTIMKHLEDSGGIELFETKLKILKSLGETGNKKALTQMIVGSTYTKTRDAFIELYMGAMLSNPSTFMPVVGVNSVSGVASLFQNYTERWLASTWLGGRGVSKAEVEEFKRGIFDALKPRSTNEEMIQDRPLKALFDAAQIQSKDVEYALHGIQLGVLDGLSIGKVGSGDAVKLGMTALAHGRGAIDNVTKLNDDMPSKAISGAAFMLDGRIGSAVDTIGDALRMGPEYMLLSDEIIKATSYSAQYRALAMRKAEREGLTGVDLDNRYNELIQVADSELVKESLQFARYITAQSPMQHPFNKKFAEMMSTVPTLKAVLVPFQRVAVNMLAYTAERTPVVNLVLKQVRDDLFSNDPARKAIAMSKVQTGTVLYTMGLGMIANEMYTGPGPIDPEARKLWTEAGNIPHALKIGDKQYALNRLEPFSTPFMILSELMSIPKHMQETDGSMEDGLRIVMGIFYHMTSDRYYMKGITQLFDAARDKSGTMLNNMLKQIAGTAVPLSGAGKAINRAGDNTVKDAWTVWENVKKSLPDEGKVFDKVPAKRTILGEPVYYDFGKMNDEDHKTLFNYDGIFTLMSPVGVKEANKDASYNEMIRLANKNLFTRKAIRDKMHFNGEIYELTHEQHTELNDIMRNEKLLDGKTGKQFVEDIVKSQEYLSLPSDVIKADILNDAVKTVHDVSIHKYMSKHPELINRGIDNKAAKVNRALGLTDDVPQRQIRQ